MKFSKVLSRLILIVSSAFLAGLLIFSFISSVAVDRMEKCYYLKDNPVFHIVLLAALILALFLYQKFCPKVGGKLCSKVGEKLSDDSTYRKIKWICLFLMFALGAAWNIATQYSSDLDARTIQNIVEWMDFGDYSAFYPGGYMDRCLNQSGLLLLEYYLSLVFGSHNQIVLLLLNVIAYVLLGNELFELLESFHVSREVQFLCWLAEFLFLPSLFYTSFLYGIFLGFAFSVMAIRREFAVFSSPKNRVLNIILVGVFCSIAIMVKQNYYIFWIVLLLYAGYELVKSKKVVNIILIAVLVGSLVFSMFVPKLILEAKTGAKLDQGYSSYSYIAMGLDKSESFSVPEVAAGWHTDNITNDYNDAEYSNAEHAQRSKERIAESLKLYVSSPKEGIDFLVRKVVSMWCDPLFQSVYVLRDGQTYQPEWSIWLSSIWNESILMKIFNPIQFVIYAGVICFILTYKKDIYALFGIVYFCGGFLFHLFWEAKSQYAFQYFIILIPYAVIGLWNVAKKLKEKSKPEMNIAPAVSSAIILIGVVVVLFAGKEISIIQSGNEAYGDYVARFKSSTLAPIAEGSYYVTNCSNSCEIAVLSEGNFAEVTCSDSLSPAVIEVQDYGNQVRFRNKNTGYYIKRYEFNDETLVLQVSSMAGGDASWIPDYISENRFILKNENDYVLTLDPETGKLVIMPYTGEDNQIWEFTPAGM